MFIDIIHKYSAQIARHSLDQSAPVRCSLNLPVPFTRLLFGWTILIGQGHRTLHTYFLKCPFWRLPVTKGAPADRSFLFKGRLSAYVGEARNRWAAAHVSDVARLYRLALEKHEAGAKYHAVAEEGVPPNRTDFAMRTPILVVKRRHPWDRNRSQLTPDPTCTEVL
jgi:hypothetical protein